MKGESEGVGAVWCPTCTISLSLGFLLQCSHRSALPLVPYHEPGTTVCCRFSIIQGNNSRDYTRKAEFSE